MLARVLRALLIERFVDDVGTERQDKTLSLLTTIYLSTLYMDFFNFTHNSLRNYTTSLNEYIYFVTFLYPQFMMPLIKLYQVYEDSQGEPNPLSSDYYESKAAAKHLNTRAFRNLQDEMLKNLYIHAVSVEDM